MSVVSRVVSGVQPRTDLAGDPLPGVDTSVKVHSRLRALPAASPEVDAKDVAALGRCADVKDLRVLRERSRQITEELDMVGIGVVRVKPGQARDGLSSHCRGYESSDPNHS